MVFQGITHIAPSINLVFTFPIIALTTALFGGIEMLTMLALAITFLVHPGHGSSYHTSNIEDGVALADEAARADLAARYPGLWQRVTTRRQFMADSLGIELRPEVLPMSNLARCLPPFWLAPQAMRRA